MHAHPDCTGTWKKEWLFTDYGTDVLTCDVCGRTAHVFEEWQALLENELAEILRELDGDGRKFLPNVYNGYRPAAKPENRIAWYWDEQNRRAV